MPTDDERREVAEAIRRIRVTREGCGRELCCDLWAALNPECPRCSDSCDRCEVSVLEYIADLIEPSTDRAALAAIVAEMDEYEVLREDVTGRAVGIFARRLRSALEGDHGHR